MNRFAHQPRDLSEMPASWFVVPAVLWSVAVAAALMASPSDPVSRSHSANANAAEVAATIEGA